MNIFNCSLLHLLNSEITAQDLFENIRPLKKICFQYLSDCNIDTDHPNVVILKVFFKLFGKVVKGWQECELKIIETFQKYGFQLLKPSELLDISDEVKRKGKIVTLNSGNFKYDFLKKLVTNTSIIHSYLKEEFKKKTQFRIIVHQPCGTMHTPDSLIITKFEGRYFVFLLEQKSSQNGTKLSLGTDRNLELNTYYTFFTSKGSIPFLLGDVFKQEDKSLFKVLSEFSSRFAQNLKTGTCNFSSSLTSHPNVKYSKKENIIQFFKNITINIVLSSTSTSSDNNNLLQPLFMDTNENDNDNSICKLHFLKKIICTIFDIFPKKKSTFTFLWKGIWSFLSNNYQQPHTKLFYILENIYNNCNKDIFNTFFQRNAKKIVNFIHSISMNHPIIKEIIDEIHELNNNNNNIKNQNKKRKIEFDEDLIPKKKKKIE